MQRLSNILIRLSQNILSVIQTSKLKLSKLLLNYIDPLFFTQGFMIGISTFSQLNTQISNYYKQRFNEKINEIFFYQMQEDRFVNIYKLIMDLGLNSQHKQYFLNAILEMNQDQKNLLMQFVGEVVKRQQFIDSNKDGEQDNFKSQISTQNMVIEEKFIQLKQQYSQLQKKYIELLESHSTLKKTSDKNLSQMTHLKQEKLQLLADLGLHHNCGYNDIIEKYRKEVSDFSKETQRLHRQLQEKSIQIKTKEKEQQELILNFTAKQYSLSSSYQQRTTELMKKSEAIEKQLEQLKQKQDQYRFEIVRLKDIIIDLRKEIQIKNSKLSEQQATIEKFNKMKKLHLEFRKAMIENYRNGVGITNAGGLGF